MKLFTAVLILLLFLVNCKKNHSEDFHNPYKDSCDEIVHGYISQNANPFPSGFAPTEIFLTYDTKGRLTEVRYIPYDGNYYYTYYKDSITIYSDFTRALGIPFSTLYLDKNGHVTSISKYTYRYSYNKQGYMDHNYVCDDSGKVIRAYDLNYQDGNLVSWVNEKVQPDGSQHRQDFFYFDKPAQDLLGDNSQFLSTVIIPGQIHLLLINGGFFGKLSKSLLRAATMDGDPPPAGDDPYIYDAKGRIIYSGNPTRSRNSYEYKCD